MQYNNILNYDNFPNILYWIFVWMQWKLVLCTSSAHIFHPSNCERWNCWCLLWLFVNNNIKKSYLFHFIVTVNVLTLKPYFTRVPFFDIMGNRKFEWDDEWNIFSIRTRFLKRRMANIAYKLKSYRILRVCFVPNVELTKVRLSTMSAS